MNQATELEILLIEDNPGDRRLLRSYLEDIPDYEFKFYFAESLMDGLELMKKYNISIIFTDLNLPDSQQLETLDRIISQKPDCPVVVTTGFNNRELGIEAVKNGADDYLFKSEINSHLLEKTIAYSIERKRLSGQLIECESRFRRMFKYSSIGIFRTSASGKIIEVNRAFAGIFGYESPTEVKDVVKNISAQLFVNPSERKKLINSFKDTKIRYKQTEIDFYKKDGSTFTGLLHMRRSDELLDGEFVLEGYIQDITHEKQTSKQIRNYLKYLRNLMDNIPSPVYSLDTNLKFTGCNKEFESYIGLKEEEILGKSITELRNSEEAELLHSKDLKLLSTKKRQVFEHSHKLTNNQDRVMMHYKNVITGHDGQVNGIIGLMMDITEKKDALALLKEELSLNEAMASLSSQLIKPGISIGEISDLILGFCKSTTEAGQGYAATLNPDTGDLVLNSHTEMFRSDAYDSNNNNVIPRGEGGQYPGLCGHSLNSLKAFYTNTPGKHESFSEMPAETIPLKNFLSVPVEINNRLAGQIVLANAPTPFNNKDLENVVKLSNLFSIAIEKVQSIEELVKSKEKAELSDKLKSAFLANMSHEIRTPLNAIVGFAQMLGEEGVGMEETREFKQVIIKNTDLLLRLINDIIEMAMIEAGELKIHPENRYVRDTMLQIFQSWRNRDEVTGTEDRIKFRLDEPEEDAGRTFDIDFMRFSQIMDNLIMNAFRFTASGEIILGYRYIDDNRVKIFVKDSGIGISKEHQRTIFERFRQVDELRVRPFSGTGLGLAITKKLTEHLSGSIEVDSKPGEGSIFTTTLPLAGVDHRHNEQIGRTDAGDTITERGSIKGKNLLIVEDNDSSYEFLEILLRKKGAKTCRAISGREAVEKHVQEHPDVILMDLQLPEMSGFDAIVNIREKDNKVPIIVQTAFSEQSEREKAFDAGCDAYLVKPITKRKLEDVLEKFC